VVHIRRDIDVVDPDVVRYLYSVLAGPLQKATGKKRKHTNANSIAIGSENLGDGKVADNDVGGALNKARRHVSRELCWGSRTILQAEVYELGVLVLANDTSVASNLDLICSLGDGTRNNNNLLRGA
jgi:hypothetical protein